jgi:hypothetical protein
MTFFFYLTQNRREGERAPIVTAQFLIEPFLIERRDNTQGVFRYD